MGVYRHIGRGVLTAASLLLVSCTLKKSLPGSSHDSELDSKREQQSNSIILRDRKEQIAQLDRSSCAPVASHHEWAIRVGSAAGRQTFTLYVPLTTLDPSITISTPQTIMKVAPRVPYPITHINRLCRTRYLEEPDLAKTSIALQSFIGNLLTTVAPDCKWGIENNRWECRLPVMTPDVARSQARTLRTTFTRRWKRIPYLVSRKLAVIGKLADLAEQVPIDPVSQDQFCTVLKNSFSSEMPLIVQSRTWRDNFCRSDSSGQPRKLVGIAIDGSIRELKVIRDVASLVSTTGLLRVKVPKKAVGSRNVRVQLNPLKEVHRSVQAALKRADSGGANVGSGSPSCWHPIFDESTRQIASELGFSKDGARGECERLLKSGRLAPLADSIDYLVSNLVGETSFIVTNGHSKILRLPKGEYAYTLTAAPSGLTGRSATPPSSSGTVIWSKRARAEIRSWQNLTN